MNRVVRFLIRAYQYTVSPVFSFLAGPGSGCRFTPTCSQYFLEAVETFGVVRGTWMGLKRLARCHPWGGQGFDPVPRRQRASSSFVNSRRRNTYGPTSMDCHHTLRHRPRGVAGLCDAASGASVDACAGFTLAFDSRDIRHPRRRPVLPSPSPSSSPAETAPAFAEKKEVLRNSDVELRLTNRGGAISEVVLLNHIDDQNQRLILNSPDRMPIGAIVQKPEAASLPEFTLSRAPDGSVQFQRDTPEHVSIRKKFFFPPTTQKKDNFLAQLDVNFRNDGAQPANYPDYYITLGSARPVHANDLSTYTHLIWCTAGKTKSIDVNWFAPQSSFLGLKRSAGHDFYGERLAGAEWAAVTNQFFATLFAPLDGKANAVWGRRFEIPRGEGLPPFPLLKARWACRD